LFVIEKRDEYQGQAGIQWASSFLIKNIEPPVVALKITASPSPSPTPYSSNVLYCIEKIIQQKAKN